jgi:hypothetical protein
MSERSELIISTVFGSSRSGEPLIDAPLLARTWSRVAGVTVHQ